MLLEVRSHHIFSFILLFQLDQIDFKIVEVLNSKDYNKETKILVTYVLTLREKIINLFDN